MLTYHVNVIGEYEFLKRDDTIASCRRWAAGTLPGQRVHVCRSYRCCETCQSAVWMSQDHVQANDEPVAETASGMNPYSAPARRNLLARLLLA